MTLPKNGSCKQWTYYGAGICISSQCTKWADDQRQALLQKQKEQEDKTKQRQEEEQQCQEEELPEKDQGVGGEGSQAELAPLAAVQAQD